MGGESGGGDLWGYREMGDDKGRGAAAGFATFLRNHYRLRPPNLPGFVRETTETVV